MRLGFFTHVAGDGPAAAVYRETVELAVAAEELGYDSFWVAQHHGGSLEGLLPSPLVLLAAAAERTSVIGLGVAVVAAPLEDPRRLAEDAAVLDELSGGRAQIGVGAGADAVASTMFGLDRVGAGADAVASTMFGLDHQQRHGHCVRAVDEVTDVLTGSWLVPPRPSLRDRLWWATGSTAGVRAASARGIGLITGRPAEPDVVAALETYWSTATGEPRVAVSRVSAPGETGDALLDRLRTDAALPWATDLLVQTQPARSPAAVHLATMETVARQVRPRLGTAATLAV